MSVCSRIQRASERKREREIFAHVIVCVASFLFFFSFAAVTTVSLLGVSISGCTVTQRLEYVFMCYPSLPLPSPPFTAHKCSVPDSAPEQSGLTVYNFTSADCSGGLPSGDCDPTLFSRKACGDDGGVIVAANPPSIQWNMNTNCGVVGRVIGATYLCYPPGISPGYTRHTCSANLASESSQTDVFVHTWTPAECNNNIPQGNCDAFLFSCAIAGGTEKNCAAVGPPHTPGITWKNPGSSTSTQVTVGVVYYCFNE
eukprot:m.156871 g.156871  ORF g.156871 m.156871 type:complete len:256 (-) comp20841_c2_seq1:5630-6397(-)